MTIKKILTTLLITCCLQNAFSQVVLSAHNIDLKKSRDYHEILTAPEAKNHGVVVFASDKNTVTALQYTRVLYYKDSIATERPDADEYDFMAGYSYNENGQPSAYWASSDYKKIQELHFDFETKTVTDYNFALPFTNEQILSTFSENNYFYIITLPKLGSKLKLYAFYEGRYLLRLLDFSAFTFKDADNHPTTLSKLLGDYSVQKVENAYTPLPPAAAKVKLYVSEKAIQFTFDQNPAYTQIFTVNTSNYSVTEKVIPQLIIKEGKSNSFLHNQKLYQVTLNDEELNLSATNILNGEVIKTYEAGKEDTITFKNSPLLEQTGDRRGNEFKNTKKFLRKAAMGDAAVSVYQTPNDIMVVTGSIRNIMPAGDLILGAMMSGATIASGVGSGDMSGMFPGNNQNVYFESLFDDSFNHKPLPQQRLAADYIGQYIAGHEKAVSMQTVFKYDYYYVLGFYDAKAKKYVMVKFQDDFVE
ncbi:hypothetical protein Q765_20515 [Flavobacterium rivuli WB 3.3-2 = DSM 21788]|uniref:Uncharacterized protein n=1 Tax=Flavobacterium rivuli WB 3.3-2 = DSM 21788 TaxID=1121895 RepID=A0A0A2LXE1_9FLAO|nr:hypothetical protein [Flavobacterium rivuli]KGO84644.1 hypothetical protein Q765_20515 [Flavobacterium rivuli WB 3.3-2 = DSM 21788]